MSSSLSLFLPYRISEHCDRYLTSLPTLNQDDATRLDDQHYFPIQPPSLLSHWLQQDYDAMPGSDTTAVGPRTRTSSSLSKTHSTKRAPTRRSSTEPEDSAPPAYSLSPKDVATRFEVDVDCGLSEEQVQDRKARYGPNQLEGAEGVSWVRVLVGQIGQSRSSFDVQETMADLF